MNLLLSDEIRVVVVRYRSDNHDQDPVPDPYQKGLDMQQWK